MSLSGIWVRGDCRIGKRAPQGQSRVGLIECRLPKGRQAQTTLGVLLMA